MPQKGRFAIVGRYGDYAKVVRRFSPGEMKSYDSLYSCAAFLPRIVRKDEERAVVLSFPIQRSFAVASLPVPGSKRFTSPSISTVTPGKSPWNLTASWA